MHKYAHAGEEMRVWLANAEAADWKSFNDLRNEMPATDYIGNDRYVFNIKGNHFRLVAMIFFAANRLYIRGIYQHKDYSRLTKAAILTL